MIIKTLSILTISSILAYVLFGILLWLITGATSVLGYHALKKGDPMFGIGPAIFWGTLLGPVTLVVVILTALGVFDD